jgi:hypothetical protein
VEALRRAGLYQKLADRWSAHSPPQWAALIPSIAPKQTKCSIANCDDGKSCVRMARWLFEQGFLSASRTFDGAIIFCRLAPIDLINKFNILCFSRTTVVRYQILGESSGLSIVPHLANTRISWGAQSTFFIGLSVAPPPREQRNIGAMAPRFFTLFSNRYAPPLGQPPLKSYRDFNEEWSVSSWEVTEPATRFQLQYIRVLAKYVR